MNTNFKFLGSTAILCLAIFVNGGCGGGTSGSGLKTISGSIVSREGARLSGVRVTVENTGDSTVSDAGGDFQIDSPVEDPTVSLLFESSQFSTRYEVESQEKARLAVDVTVDTQTRKSSFQHLSLSAGIVGLCDYYFENLDTIRQSNKVPDNTLCSLNIELLGNGIRQSNFPVALQYSRCEPGSPWKELTVVQTGTGVHAGSAEINFIFRDSEEFCRYRVLPKVKGTQFPSVSYPIDTFSEQAFFRNTGTKRKKAN